MTKAENILIPKTKLNFKTEDDSVQLSNYKCKNTVELFLKDYLPETQGLIIMWVDKNNMLSTAYCNISPLKRLELYLVGWLQELFDIKLKKNAKE